jgi:hypothetical protein
MFWRLSIWRSHDRCEVEARCEEEEGVVMRSKS